jgi:hypothetical protein
MKKYAVKQYQDKDYALWNAFVSTAKNATFLFHRDFMEYHADRFLDYSLLVFENDKLIALLPANRVADTVYSHQGLTYGGLLCQEKVKLASMLNVFKTVLFFLNQNTVKKLILKIIPSIYHSKPADEILYALFVANAILTGRETWEVINLLKGNTFSKIRKRGIQKGLQNNLIIKEETNFELFWDSILIPNLSLKFNTEPVHSVTEIVKLNRCFPENIRQFNVYHDEVIVAGVTIFETVTVAHCQYISKFETGADLSSLDFLFNFLIKERFANKRFFDFGSSNQNHGKNLNAGLSYWKESFGASTIIQDFYEVETANYYKLDTVIL